MVKELSGGRVTGELSGGRVTGELSGGRVTGELSGGRGVDVLQGGVTRQLRARHQLLYTKRLAELQQPIK